jgi:hypothetical protein
MSTKLKESVDQSSASPNVFAEGRNSHGQQRQVIEEELDNHNEQYMQGTANPKNESFQPDANEGPQNGTSKHPN